MIVEVIHYLHWNRCAWCSAHNTYRTLKGLVFGALIIYVIPVRSKSAFLFLMWFRHHSSVCQHLLSPVHIIDDKAFISHSDPLYLLDRYLWKCIMWILWHPLGLCHLALFFWSKTQWLDFWNTIWSSSSQCRLSETIDLSSAASLIWLLQSHSVVVV